MLPTAGADGGVDGRIGANVVEDAPPSPVGVLDGVLDDEVEELAPPPPPPWQIVKLIAYTLLAGSNGASG